MVRTWKATWWDGSGLRQTVFEADPWNLSQAAQIAGVWNVGGIIKLEVVPTA